MRLCIVDLETTGLNPATDLTLEIAAVIVDTNDLDHPIDRFEALIKPTSWALLDEVHPVVWEMHTQSSLFWLCHTLGRPARAVVEDFAEFLRKHAVADRIVIAGNSPHAVDVPFLRELFAAHGLGFNAKFGNFVHYRQIDVTAVAQTLAFLGFAIPTIMMERAPNAHRAMIDVEHCLAQLRALRDAYRPLLDVIAAPSPRSLQGIQDALGHLNDAVGMPARDSARHVLKASDDARRVRREREAEAAKAASLDTDKSPEGKE